MGGARAWFDQQLDDATLPDERGEGLNSWWPHLWWDPARLDEADKSGELLAVTVQGDFARWTLLRRMFSRQQVLEVMAETWSNLLHIPAPLGKSFPHRMAFDRTVREHALGRFDDLLVAAETHPAMLCYLDNARSSQEAPNENLGREVLELHTVGREASFTERDVRDSTMILTGWRVDMFGTWEPYYSTEDHYVGPVDVMGFSHQNGSPDGREVTREYLRWLARHPATARRICRRLAVRFVRDEPSRALVEDLAAAYTSSDTSIRATLRALVSHPEFDDSRWLKVRTPTEDLVNTYRVMGVEIDPPKDVEGEAAHAVLSLAESMGQRPFGWQRPDGFPDVAPAWSSASRMLGCWRVHRNTALGAFPREGIRYLPNDAWLPTLPARFDEVVDRVSRRMLARPASAELIDAASTATGIGSRDVVEPDSPLVTYRLAQLLTAVLDTPEHMIR